MIPVFAIVGRPNVGKSTLFNCLTRARHALVADEPGVTRDRIYGSATFEKKHFIVIDTGGVVGEDQGIEGLTEKQSQLAIEEADQILFVVDAKTGLHPVDETIAAQLRTIHKPIWVLVNKSEGKAADHVCAEFYALGFEHLFAIAANKKQGVAHFLSTLLHDIPAGNVLETEDNQSIKVAIVGRPNVGKSTLINRLLGEERVLAHDMPGTTRDSILVPFQRKDQRYTLIDTAGIRRRSRVHEAIEKFSVVKSIQAIQMAHVVIYLIDASETVTEQDLKLLGMVLKEGRALIIAVNKWDGLDDYQREQVKSALDRRLRFVAFAKQLFISAKHGTGVGELMPLVQACYQSATQPLNTSELTKWLEVAVEAHQPPLSKGRRIKLRYAHPGGSNPPTIVIHGNQVNKLPESYRRYLESFYRERLQFVGTPIRILFKQSENPFTPGA